MLSKWNTYCSTWNSNRTVISSVTKNIYQSIVFAGVMRRFRIKKYLPVWDFLMETCWSTNYH